MSDRCAGFCGGLRLPARKAASTGLPIARAPLPPRLILPLRQHAGQAAEPVVRVGDAVRKGQLVARPPQDGLGAALHAPSSGVVTAIASAPVPDPSGRPGLAIVIETDGADAPQHPRQDRVDAAALAPRELRARIAAAGVVGLGGGAFPSAVKLDPGRPVDTLVLNGAECEPYVSCDDMLMRERAADVLAGMVALRRLLGAATCLIGVEDDKPQAIAALRAALARAAVPWARVVPVPAAYPSGAERQLVHALTGQEVPRGGRPTDLGVLCHNVATAAAVGRAVTHGEPLLSRVVTVTGQAIARPRNLEARIGTPLRELVACCGGYAGPVERLVAGGPMTGFALPGDAVPTVKGLSCVLAAAPGELPSAPPPQPCIRCGECARVCPARLLPQQLHWHLRAGETGRARDQHLFECIECGCCDHVCPSHIPLVRSFLYAKRELRTQQRQQRQAELARARYEARNRRLAQEQAQTAAARARKRVALTGAAAGSDAKQAAIQAARARAREKKNARARTPGGDGSHDGASGPHSH